MKLWGRKPATETVQIQKPNKESGQAPTGDQSSALLRQKLGALVEGPLGFIIVRAKNSAYEVSFGGGRSLEGCFCYVHAEGITDAQKTALLNLGRFARETTDFAGSEAYRAWFSASELDEAVAITQRIFQVFNVAPAFEVKEDTITAIEYALTRGTSISWAISTTNPLTQVPLSKLTEDETNVRKEVGDLSALRSSITENDLFHPLIVRPRPDRGEGLYGVVAGKRRWLTLVELAKERGQSLDDVTVSVRIRPMDEVEALLLSVKENLARNDLKPRELYEVFERLKSADPDRFGTYEQLGQAIGKDRKYVERIYAAVQVELTTGVPVVRQARRKSHDRTRELPIGHAQRLEETLRALDLQEEERREKMRELIEAIRDLSQRRAEALLERFRAQPHAAITELRQQIIDQTRNGHLDPFPHAFTAEQLEEGLSRAARDCAIERETLREKIIAQWLHMNGYLPLPSPPTALPTSPPATTQLVPA